MVPLFLLNSILSYLYNKVNLIMKYSRVLLKLSGESLAGKENHGINENVLEQYVKQIIAVSEGGCEVAVVTGGGNIFRGLSGTESGFDRLKGDQMGMLSTIINGLALESIIKSLGGKATLFTSIRMEPVGELYNRDKVVNELIKGTICILSGGTGNPYFTTDTAAALRAVEIGANVLLKGTRVDGVYTADPEKDPKARKFESITFEEVIAGRLKIMDSTAFTMCRDNKMPIIVFDMNKSGNLMKLVNGIKTGTLISD